jgi:putrescine aminotransferase
MMVPVEGMHQMSLLEWLNDPPADRGLRLCRTDGTWEFYPYEHLADLTRRAAARLRRAGVTAGDIVVLVRAASPEIMADFFGTLLIGATPSLIAPPTAFRDPTGYIEHLGEAIRMVQARAVATTAELAPLFAPIVKSCGGAIVTDIPVDEPRVEGPPEPPEIGLVQVTSKLTSQRRSVRIPLAALDAHLAAIRRWLNTTADDTHASWLPPDHGMGLIGQFLLPVHDQATFSFMQPKDFIRSPLNWLRCFHTGGATLGAIPAKALAHVVRRVRPDQLYGLDFSGWRSLVLGAEGIAPATVDAFLRLLAPCGFTKQVIVPAYGSTVPTFAVTGGACGAGLTTVSVNQPSLILGESVDMKPQWGRGTKLIGCGAPIDGMGVRVVDRHGSPVADGVLGEIEVRGNPLAAGLAGDAPSGGAMTTGDVGFRHDGQLFVVGPLGAATPTIAAGHVFNQLRQHLPPRLAMATKLAGSGAVEVSGMGCHVRLSDGRVALDFGSYAVTLLGHRHPAVVQAVRQQLDTMPTATRLLANPWTAAAAERLSEYLDGRLNRVWFGANGSDAVDAAVKLALIASGRTRILAVEGAFHGKTLGVLPLTQHGRYRAGLSPLAYQVTHLPADDPGAVTRELARGDVAALLFEPIQGENGVQPLDPSILAAWCSAAAADGAFVIADEIQTGLRRCGERSLALAADLPVNAVLLGKPLAGGVLPMSAVVCDEQLYAPLVADPMVHTATFAGHPLASAVVPVALEAIEELAARTTRIGAAMAASLAGLHSTYPNVVRDVRGQGLLWGLELASANAASALVPRLARNGLLVSPCMGGSSTLRLLPPIVAGDAEVAQALEIVEASLHALDAGGGRRADASAARS